MSKVFFKKNPNSKYTTFEQCDVIGRNYGFQNAIKLRMQDGTVMITSEDRVFQEKTLTEFQLKLREERRKEEFDRERLAEKVITYLSKNGPSTLSEILSDTEEWTPQNVHAKIRCYKEFSGVIRDPVTKKYSLKGN